MKMIELHRKTPARLPGKVRGFTLLEVVIALTITSLVLGSLMALAAGSKQLAARSQEQLRNAVHTRAVTNFALLDDQHRDLEPVLLGERYRIQAGELLEDPLRRTAPTQYLLETYHLIEQDSDEPIVGTRWVRFDLPR